VQIAFSDVNPKEFAEWILPISHMFFSAVAMVISNAFRRRAPWTFLHTNLVYSGTVSDLLVTNYDRRLTFAPNLLWTRRLASYYRWTRLARKLHGLLKRRLP